MVTTLQNIWYKHRREIILGGAMITLMAVLLPLAVHAQTPPATTTPDTACANVISGLGNIVSILKRVLWPVLLMIGGLMQNDILFGPGMEQVLTQIWINIRNIVNILFVLVLLLIALVNVVGAAERFQYKLNEILPKFVIALIAVNFTFLGAKLVLDGVNIVSTSIFALPSQVQQSLQAQGANTTPNPNGPMSITDINSFCGAIYGAGSSDLQHDATYNQNLTAATQNGGSSQTICNAAPATSGPNQGSYLNYGNATMANFFSSMNSQNAALIMAIQLQNTSQLDTVYVNQPLCNGLLVNTLFTIILFIVYATAYIALFAVLLVRLVVLWVMIAISPLMFLPMVLPEAVKGSLGEVGDLGTKFVKNAIVPIPVALVMTIGYIMFNSMKQFGNPSGTASAFINSNPTLSLGLYTSGLTTLQQLIISLGTVAFIWVGVFEALKGTYADHIVESIKNTVGEAGRTVGGFAVKRIPLFPVTRTEGGKKITQNANIGDVMLATGNLRGQLQERERAHARAILPGAFSTQSEAASKIGRAKSKEDARTAWKDVNDYDDKGLKSNVASWLKNDQRTQQELQKFATDHGYANSKAFMDALEKNPDSVSGQTMRDLETTLGFKGGQAPTPGGPVETKKEEVKKADLATAGSLFKRKGDLQKNHVLSQGEATELSGLENTINRTKNSNKPKDVEDYNKAMARVKELNDKVENFENDNSSAATDLRTTVFNGAINNDFQGIENKLKSTIAQLSGNAQEGTPEYEAAQKRVLSLASSRMSKQQQDSLITAAGGKDKVPLLASITPTAAAPAAAQPGNPPPGAAPAADPNMPDGTANEGDNKIGKDNKTLYVMTNGKWVKKP